MGITAHLMGGMGNQMFQYAFACQAAMRFNTDLRLNVSSFQHCNMREYSLGLWKGVNQPICYDYSGEVIRESGLPYNQGIVDRLSRNCTLYGYWQTEKYFSSIRGLLKEKFVPKMPLTDLAQSFEMEIKSKGKRSVFLTIRRTDYVGNDFHGLLPMDYYLKAAELLSQIVTDPHFFVFTDEPDWAIQHFKFPYNTTIAGNFDRTVKGHLGREDSELWLMRQCQHAIMANSSYSWWGAWLGNADAGGVVIAPKRWFGKSGNEDPRDICPDRWMRL